MNTPLYDVLRDALIEGREDAVRVLLVEIMRDMLIEGRDPHIRVFAAELLRCSPMSPLELLCVARERLEKSSDGTVMIEVECSLDTAINVASELLDRRAEPEDFDNRDSRRPQIFMDNGRVVLDPSHYPRRGRDRSTRY